MRSSQKIRILLTVIVLGYVTAGCATAPKPKTIGDVVGSALDSSIAWTSKGIQTLLNK